MQGGLDRGVHVSSGFVFVSFKTCSSRSSEKLTGECSWSISPSVYKSRMSPLPRSAISFKGYFPFSKTEGSKCSMST